MSEVLWPKPNPEADRLLSRMLDRFSPGWALRMGEANVSPAETVDLLWQWNPMFQGVADNKRPSAKAVEEADDALQRLAEGQTAVFAGLSREALGVLKGRHSLAVAGATYRIVAGDTDPILLLPHGLTVEQRQFAVTVRMLFQAETEIAHS